MNAYRMTRLASAALSLLAVSFVFAGQNAECADGYGAVTGQFVLDGEIPEVTVLVEKGDLNVKDAAVCAKHGVLSEELVVDPKSKGIRDVFIYMRKAPKDVHPELKNSKVKEIVFDQRGCQFKPHALFVRTDQVVVVKSDDACAHNTHTYPIRGQAINFLLQPNNRVGVKVPNKVREILPMQVKCDIHTYMKSHWLVLDHPYAAITDKDGKFKIEGLPAGKHEFRVWHELVGYIDRKFTVTVTAGETEKKEPVKVPVAKFQPVAAAAAGK